MPDPHQLDAVRALDELSHELQASPPSSRWQRLRRPATQAVSGLYLWGGVGRGKTWLMDLFFELLPEGGKRRIHFHRFMQEIHHALARMEKVQDPLAELAAGWARDYRVLCLDEFLVEDIADAMILSGLLQNLFSRGVTLVTTSNHAPEDLYRDGLQRAKFLPAIALIQQHTRVLQLEGSTDFRLRMSETSEFYHWPVDDQADVIMQRSFERIAAGCEFGNRLEINDRPFQAIRRGNGVIWFSFGELCEKPCGSIDFIEIARAYSSVLISGVPQLGEADTNAAKRFILLVDEFYDRGVKLLLSAGAPLESLYTGTRLAFEFQRTQSRLTEMQTQTYLERPHLP